MKYQIIYNGELVDTAYDEQVASDMLKEYRLAFHSNNIYIRVVY